MISVYAYWIFVAVLIFILMEFVSYEEVEEQNSIDKSPKHLMIFNPKSILMGSLVIAFLLISILINR